MNKFTWMKAFNSPFKRIKIYFYAGKIRHGVPFFYPRKWISKKGERYSTAIPKKIGFDFVGLGWKTKWTDKDIRFEYNPIWSFVFFKWQVCLLFIPPEPHHYWESWLYYEMHTDDTKSQKERIEQCRKEFPQKWIQHSKEGRKEINYYELILK